MSSYLNILAKSFLVRKSAVLFAFFQIYAHLDNKLHFYKQNLLCKGTISLVKAPLNTLTFHMVAIMSESAAVVSMAERMRAIQPF